MTTVAIMRTKDKKEESELIARELGLEVRFASPLELSETDSPTFTRFMDEIESGQAGKVVVTSVTALRFMVQLLTKRQKASAVLRRLNEMGGVLAIGVQTAEAVRKEWIKVEALPDRFDADDLSERLHGKVKGRKVWVVRSERSSKVLLDGLQKAGAVVEEVPVYVLKEATPDRALLDVWYWTVHGGINVYAFTSPMTAKAFMEGGEKSYGVRDFGTALNEGLIAAINEQTKRTLEEMGVDVDILPAEPTFEAMMKAIRLFLDRSH